MLRLMVVVVLVVASVAADHPGLGPHDHHHPHDGHEHGAEVGDHAHGPGTHTHDGHVHGPGDHSDHPHGPHSDHPHGPHSDHPHGPHSHSDHAHGPHSHSDHAHGPTTRVKTQQNFGIEVSYRAEVDLTPVTPEAVGGSLDLFQTKYGVSLIGEIANLAPGKHGISINEGADCRNPGPRFNPTQVRLSSTLRLKKPKK